MLSVVNVSETSQALSYYQADNYYVNEEETLDDTQWYGRAAQALGMNGKVDAERFAQLLDGKVDGYQLGRPRTGKDGEKIDEHRSAFDLTFSAPKSVSIMAEVYENQDILQAHQDAVKQTLDYIEQNNVETRISVDGKMERTNSDNLIVAMFNHNTSRALDPQTHTHAVVMNATINQKGEWSSISNESIFNDQSLIGAIYNTNLASNLKNIGVDIQVKDSKGNFEIEGFTPDMIAEFSQRREQIKQKLADRGIDIDEASPHAKEMATLDTRERKENVIESELRTDWVERANSIGITSKLIDGINNKIKIAKVAQKTGSIDKQPEEPNQNLKEPEILKPDFQDTKDSQRPEGMPNTFSESSPESDISVVREHEDFNHGEVPRNEENEHLERNNSKQNLGNVDRGEGNEATIDNLEMPEWLKSEYSDPNNGVNFKKTKTRTASVQLPDKTPINYQQVNITKQTKELVFSAIGHHSERETMFSEKQLITTALKLGVGKTNEIQIKAEIARLKDQNIIIQMGQKLARQKQAQEEILGLTRIREDNKSVSPIVDVKEADERVNQEEALREYKYTDTQRSALMTTLTTNNRFVAVQGLAGTGKTTFTFSLNKIAKEYGFVVKGMALGGSQQSTLQNESGIESNTITMFLINENKRIKELEAQGLPIDQGREIWVADEKSLVGQEHFNEIVALAKMTNSRLVMLGDIHQLKSISAGKPFEAAQKRGAIEVAYMNQIMRQKEKGLIDTVATIVAPNREGKIDLSKNAEAFEMLQSQNRVHEIGVAEDKKIESKIVSEYMSDQGSGRGDNLSTELAIPKEIVGNVQAVHHSLVNSYMDQNAETRSNTLVITPFNKDRVVLNEMIRGKMKQNDELAKQGIEKNILVNNNLTEEFKRYAMNYELGDVVLFRDGFVDQKKGVKIGRNSYLDVINKNRDGTIVLKDQDGKSVNWNPKKGTVEVYKKEKRELVQGDKIKFTRSDKLHDVKNGEHFNVKKIEDNVVHLTGDTGERSIHLDNLNHWDHGYVTTIYSSQGLTKGKVFLLLNSSKLVKDLQGDKAATKVLGQAFGRQSFYVAVTRASHDLNIYTDNIARSKEAITFNQDKSSFLDEVDKNKMPIPEKEIHTISTGIDHEL